MNDHRGRPVVPKASRFEVLVCDNPACGAHLLAYDEDDEPMVEIVLGQESVLKTMGWFYHLLKSKGVIHEQ